MARAKASKVKRSDDNEETINKRLGVFTGQSEPVIAKWKEDGKKVVEIDAAKDIDAVHKDTME